MAGRCRPQPTSAVSSDRPILTAQLYQSRPLDTGSIALPASRFLCEHLRQNDFIWACTSRIHAQVPVVTTGKLTKTLRQQISCSINISIMVAAALRAGPRALIESQLVQNMPTLRAALARRIPTIHLDKHPTAPLAFVRQLTAQLAERGIVHRTGVSASSQAIHVQVFNRNQIELTHQTRGQCMQVVLTRVAHSCVCPCHATALPRIPSTTLVAPRETPLLLTQVPQSALMMLLIADHFPGGERRQMTQSQVHTHRALHDRQQSTRYLHAEANVISPGCIAREADHARPLDFRKRLGELESADLGQAKDSATPGHADPLKPKASGATLTLELRIASPAGKKVTEGLILIAQALRQHRGRDTRKPLMSGRSLPLRQPPREIIARKRQSADSIGFRANRERCVPQPACRSKPTVEQRPLHAVRIGSNAVAAGNAAHVSIITCL